MIGSPAQLIAILVVALLLFGPRKLPELAQGLGQSVREFKKSVDGINEEIKNGPPVPDEVSKRQEGSLSASGTPSPEQKPPRG